MVDNRSGDFSYYASALPSTVFYLPAMARITGVGGTLFACEFTLFNVSESSNNVTLTFFERERDNTNGAKTASVVLGPRETRLLTDALGSLFGLSETYGSLKIESSDPVVVSERVYSTPPTTAGTVGEQVNPIPPDGFSAHASILGLRQDDTFRSNIGLFNPNPDAVSVILTLRRPSGEILGDTTVALFPYGFAQRNLSALFPSVVFPPGEPLTLAIDAGTSPIAAYGIIADNVSQDLTASPALP
ncbi:MAG: hypothetical protein ABI968_10595 [Acidobacteriota bacterium]